MRPRLWLLLAVLLWALLCGPARANVAPAIPETAEIDFAAGTAAYLAGDYRQASERFSRAYAACPELREALYWEGLSAAALGDFGRAEQRLRSFIQSEPDPAASPANFDLGVALIGQERWSEALQQLASTGAQTRPELHYYRGLCLVRLGRTAEARVELDLAMQQTPGLRDRALALLAACDMAEHNPRQAARDLRQARELTSDPGLRRQLADATLGVERAARAQRWWSAWVRLGAGYDTNATRVSDEIEDASPQAGLADAALQGLLLPLHGPRLRQWIGYRFDGRLHFNYDQDQQPDAGEYDMLRHRGLLGLQGLIGNAGFGLQPALGYAFSHVTLGGEDYLLEHRIDPSLTLLESDWIATRLGYSLLLDDYYELPELDGPAQRAQLSQVFMFWDNAGRASLGLGGELRQAEERRLNRECWWALAGLDAPLVRGLRIDLSYQFRRDVYADDPQQRSETGHHLGLGLGRTFLGRLTVEGRIAMSTVAARPQEYNYTRLLSGAYVTWEF